jgi:nucleotide-binding universal stress UspA family protein
MKANRTAWPPLVPPSQGRLASARQNGRARAAPAVRILVPVDFSTESRRALKYAGAVGKRFRASVTLVHVVNPLTCEADYGYGVVTRQVPDQSEVRKARARLTRLSLKMTGRPNCAKVLVLSGTAPFEITQAAKALGTDLIIMSSHGESETARQLGSTAEQVMRQAPCPVFVLKKKVCGARKVR